MCKLRRSKRAKRLRVQIESDGTVIAIAPIRASRAVVLEFVESQVAWIKKSRAKVLSAERDPNITTLCPKHYAAHKEHARTLIHVRVEHYCEAHGFAVNTIRVKRMKTQWGSCSPKKNLNFNYKILFLPAHVQDYLIVHELCHLREMNHSARFWAQVEAILPDHKERRKALRKIYL